MRTLIIFVSTLFILSLNVKAQDVIRCYSTEISAQLPKDLQKASKNSLRNAITHEQNTKHQKTQYVADGVWRIPTVVHIIHNNGPENISDAQVQSSINALNDDFRKKAGTEGDGPGVDAQIEFYLAGIDPSGNVTSGITRTLDSNATNHGCLFVDDSTLKAVIQWPQTAYMNIYVVDTIPCGGAYILGYASLPANGNNIYDGIVIADDFFGDSTGTTIGSQPYHKNRTLTHEVGHWLGLYHPFNCVNTTGNCCEGTNSTSCDTLGDYICDTYPIFGPHFGCPAGPLNTCSETPDSNDQLTLYMDYVDDNCMDMFTSDQADRMQSTLTVDTGRLNLSSTENLILTGVTYYGMPDAYFGVYPANILLAQPFSLVYTHSSASFCVYDSIRLYDLSPGTMYDYLNGVVSAPTPDTKWAWSLPFATPDTSNAQNPVISFDTVGTFPISLTVTNLNGFRTFPGLITITGTQVTIGADTAIIPAASNFFSNMPNPGYHFWTFSSNPGDTSNQQNPSFAYPFAGAFNYSYSFTPFDTTQCSLSLGGIVVVRNPTGGLPIELSLFNAKWEAPNEVTLFWTTEMEYNNDFFEVEKSVDGVNFNSIARIEGAGFSTKPLSYKALDKNPRTINYYRLKQTDFDGNHTWSDLITVSNPLAINVDVFFDQASQTLSINNPEQVDLTITIYNALGAQIDQFKSPDHSSLHLDHFSKGIYFASSSINGIEGATLKFSVR